MAGLLMISIVLVLALCVCLQAINNPKGRIPGSSSDHSSSSSGSSLSGGSRGSEGLRRGTKPGEGAVREVAAYVLDHGHFSGVPPTALVNAYVSDDNGSGTAGAVKVGSLQQFVESEGDCEERGECPALGLHAAGRTRVYTCIAAHNRG